MGETGVKTREESGTVLDTLPVGEEPQQIAGKTGVTASAFEAQKWRPGQTGNVHGRPKSDKLYKMALLKRFSPDELADYA
jgi:hypothetical protein